MALIGRVQPDRSKGVPGPIDADVEPAAREGDAQAVRPFDERDAGSLAVVEQPTRDRLIRARQPVQVDMEEPQPPDVLGHEDKARRADGRRHAEPGAEALREDGLPGAKLTPQAEHVAWLRDPGERGAQGEGLLGRRGFEAPIVIGRAGHPAEGSRSRRGRRSGSGEALEIAERDPGVTLWPE